MHIYTINFSKKDYEKKFLKQFSSAASQQEAQVENLNSDYLMFLSGESERDTRVFYKDKEIELVKNNQSVFFRKRTTRPTTVALLANLLRLRGINFNGVANTFHTSMTNKSFQSILLSEQGHRFPKTLVGLAQTMISNQIVIEENFDYPFILKSPGSKGQAVSKIKNKEELSQILSGFDSSADTLISIQKFIENDFDMRALIFEGKFIGSYARERGDHEFLNNLANGATLKPVELSQKEKDACCSVATDSPADLVGIDLIRVSNNHFFLELNRSPEIYPFFDLDQDFDLGGKIFDIFNSDK